MGNSPPSYNSALISHTLALGDTTTYTLPGFSDPDGDWTTQSLLTTSPPGLFTFSANTFYISPPLNSFTLVGSHIIDLKLDNWCHKPVYSFTIYVTNTAPYYSLPVVTSIPDMHLGKTSTFNIPTTVVDDEGHAHTFTFIGGGYSSVNAAKSVVTVNPTLYSDLGAKVI